MPVSLESIMEKMQKTVGLAPFTTFHLGGPAEFFIQAETEEELVMAVVAAKKQKMPLFLLGGGSNLVVSDQGIPGLVVRNHSRNQSTIDVQTGLISFSSGFSLARVVEQVAQRGLTGMEPFTGIPGTLGGAIYGNAGAYGKCIGDLLVAADILTEDGQVIRVDNSYFAFQYRTSALKKNSDIVLSATLKLAAGNLELIRAQMNDILAQRESKHPPLSVGSAGSFFKNLDPSPGESRRRAAGEVLEKAGAKSMAVGGASVYTKHANFIVNYGQATAKDVKRLAHLMRQKVLEMFGIELHEEVLYVGG